MNARVVSIERIDYERATVVCIRTARGQFVGRYTDHDVVCAAKLPVNCTDLVDVWHPVPRWMRPSQCLTHTKKH